MAARTKPEILPIDDDEIPLRQAAQYVEPDAPEDVALSNVLADLGGESDAKVNVYLVEPGKGNSFVGTFDPVSFSIEAIQQTYGAGEYKIHVRRDGRLVANRTIRIAQPKTAQIPAMSPLTGKDDINKLAETMNAGFQSMANMLAQAVQSVAANQPKSKTTQEMLQEMMLMKQLLEPPQPAQNANQIDLFMKGIEFAQGITPREGDPGAGEIILEAIKNFGGVLSQAKTMPSAPAPVRQVPLPPAPAQPSHAAQPAQAPQPARAPQPAQFAQPSTDENMNLAKRMYLNLLLKNAEVDNDPMTYAALAIDVQGETAVREFVNRPQWFDLLCSELPEAANYRPWFEEMRENILTLLSQTAPAEDLTETPVSATQEEINDPVAADNAIQQPPEAA